MDYLDSSEGHGEGIKIMRKCSLCLRNVCSFSPNIMMILPEKYFFEFSFYLAKHVNEILANIRHQTHVIHYKECLLWIDNREHIRQYFSKNQALHLLKKEEKVCVNQSKVPKSTKSSLHSGFSKTVLSVNSKKPDDKYFPKFFSIKINEIMYKRERKYMKISNGEESKRVNKNVDFQPLLSSLTPFQRTQWEENCSIYDIYNPDFSNEIVENSLAEDFPEFYDDSDLASPFDLNQEAENAIFKAQKSPKRRKKKTKREVAPSELVQPLSEIRSIKMKHKSCLKRITAIVEKYSIRSSFKGRFNDSSSYNSLLHNLTERLKSKREHSGFLTSRNN